MENPVQVASRPSTASRPLPALTADRLDALRRCRNAIEVHGGRYEIEAHYAPSDALRDALLRHAHALRTVLQPAGLEYAGSVVSLIFTYFADFSGGGEGALFELEAYATPLAQFPTWALQHMRSKVENSRERYRLSLPMLKGWADDARRPIADELGDIESVLAATIISSASGSAKRREFGALLRQAVSKLQPPDKPDRGPLMPPSMAKALAGDTSVPLSDFVSAAREVKFAPARKSTSAGRGDD
jgi:hypothetical protein